MSELKYSKEQIIDACKEAGLGILECNSLITALGCCQPEATAPAQDLSAAILALSAGNGGYALGKEVAYRDGFKAAREAAAALASSPVDALGAGDSEKLSQVREAILIYYDALNSRQHGGVAQDRALNAIQEALGMSWQSGIDQRAILQSQAGKNG